MKHHTLKYSLGKLDRKVYQQASIQNSKGQHVYNVIEICLM